MSRLFSLPAWLQIGAGLSLLAIVVYLVVRAMREGREISFWPPRIGAKPPTQLSTEAKALATEPSHVHTDLQSLAAAPGSSVIGAEGVPANPASPETLPGKTYAQLWGRETDIKNILAALRDPASYGLLAITGLGGIGKTALAREVVARIQSEVPSRSVGWVTLKEEILEGGALLRNQLPASSATALVNKLLFAFAIKPQSLDHLEWLKRHFSRTSCVAVVDNIETIPEIASVIAQLSQVVNPVSRIILTSRPQLQQYGEIFAFPISGLSEPDCASFIREEAGNEGYSLATNRIFQDSSGDIFRDRRCSPCDETRRRTGHTPSPRCCPATTG